MRFRQRLATPIFAPPVSILKPVRGADPAFYEAIRSQAEQEYPGEVEILFGVGDPQDTALPAIRRLQGDFPHHRIRIVDVRTEAPNGKVGSLIDLAREARFDTLVLSDSDIRVEKDYLSKVVAPLADPAVGLVTCLYRAHSDSFAGLCEAIGIETDFAPSALVAPLFGVDEFAFGSTIAIRKADLEKAGGFEAVRDYLADDYQIGKRIHALGLKCVLGEPVVDTHMSVASFRQAWQHQVRWARTIRVSRPGGYAGLFVTFATVWGLVLVFEFGQIRLGCSLLLLRMLAAAIAGVGVMRSVQTARYLWLVPLRDLFGAAVWIAGLAGSTVQWRGLRLKLGNDGRIVEKRPGPPHP